MTSANLDSAKNKIGFEIVTHGSGAREVAPFVDGERFNVARFEEAAGFSTPGSYAGIVPDHFRFAPLINRFIGTGDWNPGAPAVLGCDCLEWGCWPFHAVVEVTNDRGDGHRFSASRRTATTRTSVPSSSTALGMYEGAVAELATALEQSDG